MPMKKTLFILSIIPVFVFAKEKENKQQFSISTGYVQTTGNTETSTANIKTKYTYKTDSKRIYFDLNAVYGSTNGKKSSEYIDGNIRFEKRKFPYFFFWDIHYYRNPFQGYKHSIGTGPGIGRYFYHNAQSYLSLSYYVYYVYNDLNQPSLYTNKYFERYFLHHIEERFKKKFTKSLKFTQKLVYKVSSRKRQDYFVYFESSIINSFTKHLALEISYTINYQNLPLGSKIKRLDTTLSTLVQYNF